MKKYTFHISILALILALSGLGCVLFQNWNKDWDSVMFAVAMLSGLVMILIGWNIYSLIDVKNFKDDAEKKIASLEKRNEAIKENFNMEVVRINAVLFDSVSLPYKRVESDHREFLYAFFTIQSICAYSTLGNVEASITRINDLIDTIPTNKPISEKDKSFLIDSIKKAKLIEHAEYLGRLKALDYILLKW
ncbi:hypothetical protein [Dysgonomonas mossii]|uniref:hypothetical protein n=1 Tax=Dysgonomonas mossii TaxID=163665 RepID=UPI003994242F